MIDYDTLKLVWWALIGLLLIGFVITDGFDMGVATLLPFLGRTDFCAAYRSGLRRTCGSCTPVPPRI